MKTYADGSIVESGYNDCQVFSKDSDWSSFITVPMKTLGIVIKSGKRITGAGRCWHKLLVSINGTPTVGWIPSPSDWREIWESA